MPPESGPFRLHPGDQHGLPAGQRPRLPPAAHALVVAGRLGDDAQLAALGRQSEDLRRRHTHGQHELLVRGEAQRRPARQLVADRRRWSGRPPVLQSDPLQGQLVRSRILRRQERQPPAVGRQRRGSRSLGAVDAQLLFAIQPPRDEERGQHAEVGPLLGRGAVDDVARVRRDRDQPQEARLAGERQREVEHPVRGRRRARGAAAEPVAGDRDRDEECYAGKQRTPARPRGGRRRDRLAARDRFLEPQARVADVAQPLARVLHQAAREQLAHARGRRCGQTRPVRLALQDGSHQVADRLAAEEPPSREAFVQQAAEGPDVRAPVERPAPHLLGTHVAGRAEHQPLLAHEEAVLDRRARVPRGLERCQRLRQAEVEHLDRALGRHAHVRRLEVAVDHAGLVRRLESLGDLAAQVERFLDGQGAARDPLGEVLARHQLEHEIRAAPGLVHLVDLRDVGMVQGREDPRLALEAPQAILVGRQRVREHLDRDLALQPRVLRAVDLAHASGTERAEDLVLGEPVAGGEGHVPGLRAGYSRGAGDRRRVRRG
jgi:hypothetical protein